MAENIFLGRELRTRLGTVDRRRMNQVTRGLLERCGVALDPRRPVGELRTGEQQLVTIAKALSLDARVLIMDEPTSALSSVEVEQMFTVISELRRAGAGIVYISHRMDEIGRIADRATVLRNGAFVAEFDAREMTAERAAEAMVGRPVQAMFRTRDVEPGEEILAVTDLALTPTPGAVRAARTRRHQPVRAARRDRRGRRPARLRAHRAARDAVRRRLGRHAARRDPVPWQAVSGRTGRGRRCVPGWRSCRRTGGSRVSRSTTRCSRTPCCPLWTGWRWPVSCGGARETGAVRRIVGELKVKLGSVTDPVGTLSGGNQQKVVFGRMLLTEPALLLLDEPTRGVDVGAKAEIYQLLGEAAQQGIGVLLASSELAELVGVCDRVVVLSDGRSVRELDTRQAGEADLLAASMGEGSTAMAVDVAGGES